MMKNTELSRLGTGATSLAVYLFNPPSMLVISGILILVGAIYLGFRVFLYPFYFSPFRNLPEPTGAKFPWAHAEILRNQHNGAPFRTWTNTVPNDGLIRFRVLFNQERLLITSPSALKEVLVTKVADFEKPDQPTFLFRKLLGNGVLVAEGDIHKRQRKALMPAFSFRHIKDLYPVFWDKARQASNEMAMVIAKTTQSHVDRTAVLSTFDWASRTTLDIIGLASMGQDFGTIQNPESKAGKIYEKMFANEAPHFRWTVIGVLAPLKIFFRLPLPLLKDAQNAAKGVRDLGYDALGLKHSQSNDSAEANVDTLSVAMRSKEFSDGELVDQMMTFLAAGHETTACALTWAIYQLCQHPNVQARLRKEVRSALPSIQDPDSTVSANQIDKLPYLNAVCNEVLRILPSVPMTIRDAMVDTSIQGQHVPRGTRIFIAPWGTNVSIELWGQDALTFNPDRWLGAGMANVGGARNNFANLTFLHGPRSCIGKDFAKGEFLCVLAAWVGRFEINWTDGRELPLDVHGWVTVRPEHKLPVTYKEIEGW